MRLLVTGGSGFIGTNLVEHFAKNVPTLISVDSVPPHIKEHTSYWKQCDIMDADALNALFAEVQPTHVIHLAARTDVAGKTLEDYAVNVEGSKNVLDAVKNSPSVERLIMTSTQFVHRPGHLPENDNDYEPHTVYGESKVLTEKLTKSANLQCVWTIVRPTNIWGPWHPRYPKEFWHVLARGLYVHPAGKAVIRSYGYVKNVVHQYELILHAPDSLVNQRVYYVGDGNIDNYLWASGFSVAITGKKARRVPRPILRTIALVGDLVNGLGGNFPLFSSRYESMISDYATPIDATCETFGTPPYTLEHGIGETVEWLRREKLI